MARYFFDVRHDGKLTADEEGEELSDIDAAEVEARLAAVHLTKELLSASTRKLAVEVRNENGQPIVRAKVSLDVERVDCPPTAPHPQN
jgi:hypothetical protein